MWGRLELFREEEKRLGFVGKTVSSFSSMLLRAVADDERWLGFSSSVLDGAEENLLSFFATAGSSISGILLLPPGIL